VRIFSVLGVPVASNQSYNFYEFFMSVPVSNSRLPECWLDSLVCPRRYRAFLPSCVRANLFGSD
jgi:hypothetical protein